MEWDYGGNSITRMCPVLWSGGLIVKGLLFLNVIRHSNTDTGGL